MKTQTLLMALTGALLLAVPLRAEESVWMTDLAKAKELAAARKIPILIDFAGTDWCGWCMKLDREVFSETAFKDYARDNLILVLADFPAKKALDEKTTAQNKELASQFGVKGFPTVLLMDAEGKELGRTGYQPGGAEKYVETLKTILAKSSQKKPAGDTMKKVGER